MPQLNFYVPEHVAQEIKTKARKHGTNTSAYLAELVKTQVAKNLGWQKGFFDNVIGGWQGDFPPIKRPKPDEIDFP